MTAEICHCVVFKQLQAGMSLTWSIKNPTVTSTQFLNELSIFYSTALVLNAEGPADSSKSHCNIQLKSHLFCHSSNVTLILSLNLFPGFPPSSTSHSSFIVHTSVCSHFISSALSLFSFFFFFKVSGRDSNLQTWQIKLSLSLSAFLSPLSAFFCVIILCCTPQPLPFLTNSSWSLSHYNCT